MKHTKKHALMESARNALALSGELSLQLGHLVVDAAPERNESGVREYLMYEGLRAEIVELHRQIEEVVKLAEAI